MNNIWRSSTKVVLIDITRVKMILVFILLSAISSPCQKRLKSTFENTQIIEYNTFLTTCCFFLPLTEETAVLYTPCTLADVTRQMKGVAGQSFASLWSPTDQGKDLPPDAKEMMRKFSRDTYSVSLNISQTPLTCRSVLEFLFSKFLNVLFS